MERKCSNQWQIIKELLASQRKRKHELCNVFNALFYVAKGGISWRQMPNDLTLRHGAQVGKRYTITFASFRNWASGLRSMMRYAKSYESGLAVKQLVKQLHRQP